MDMLTVDLSARPQAKVGDRCALGARTSYRARCSSYARTCVEPCDGDARTGPAPLGIKVVGS